MASATTGAQHKLQPKTLADVEPVRPGDPEFGERACAFVNDTWTKRKSAYIVYHQSIWESLLFYVGQSWIKATSNTKLYEPAKADDDYTPQPRINRFAPSIDAIASNFSIPEVEYSPSRPDDLVSTAVSEIASKLADHFLKESGLRNDNRKADEDKVGTSRQLFVLAGCVFSRVVPEFEEVGRVPLTQELPGLGLSCPTCDSYAEVPADSLMPAADGTVPCPTCNTPIMPEQTTISAPLLNEDTGEPETAPITKARIVVHMDSPLTAFPRQGAKTMRDSNNFLMAQRYTLDDIYRLWDYEAEADNIWPDGYSVMYESSLSYYYMGFGSASAQNQDSAMVLQMFVEPGKMKEFPDGLYCVSVNQKLVKACGWDELFDDHPITKATYLGIPHLFFPRSAAFDLVEIQRETNSYESIIKLHGMTTAATPIVCEENSVTSEITGRGDKIIYWRAVGPNSKEPHHMEHGSLDEGVYAQRESLRQDFKDISMAVNSFRGQQDGGADSGVAINQLRAQAEQMFSQPTTNWATFVKETVRKAVKLIQKHYSVSQLQEILGPDLAVEIQQFKTANLDLLTECLASAHGLPKTRDQRRDEMMMLFDKGALDIQDPAVKQKVFELFGDTGMMSTFNLDASRARRENAMMREGTPAQVMPEIEDLAVHLSQHLNKAKSSEFDMWEPLAKQLLIEHIMETRNAMAMMQAQAAALAAPPVKPGKDENQPKQGAAQ